VRTDEFLRAFGNCHALISALMRAQRRSLSA
jgi:hypothetical protein